MLRRPFPSPSTAEERKDLFGPVADLMVGVIFIFIILLIGLALHLQPEDYQRLRDRNAELEKQNDELETENARLRTFGQYVRDHQLGGLLARIGAANETRAQLLTDIQHRLRTLGVEVTIDPVNGTLRLPAGGLFRVGQAEPTDRGRETIRKLGDVLAATLPCYTAAADHRESCRTAAESNPYSSLSSAYIEGHTDVVPFSASFGQYRNNWDLSAGRAIETYRLLGTTHPQLQALRNRDGEALLGVSGYAETRPATTAPERRDEAVRDLDRRIEVRLIMTANETAVRAAIAELNQQLEQVDDLLR